MPKKLTDVYVKCPFYQKEFRQVICCEGFVKNTCMTTSFPDMESKKSHLEKNCYLEDGGGCPMAQRLFSKYGVNAPWIK